MSCGAGARNRRGATERRGRVLDNEKARTLMRGAALRKSDDLGHHLTEGNTALARRGALCGGAYIFCLAQSAERRQIVGLVKLDADISAAKLPGCDKRRARATERVKDSAGRLAESSDERRKRLDGLLGGMQPMHEVSGIQSVAMPIKRSCAGVQSFEQPLAIKCAFMTLLPSRAR